MTNSNVLKVVTELFTFSSLLLPYISLLLLFILYVAAYMANKVVYIKLHYNPLIFDKVTEKYVGSFLWPTV